MLDLHFAIKNIFSSKRVTFKKIYYVNKKISENKSFEFQLSYLKGTFDIFRLSILTDHNGHDHAGPAFNIEIGPLYLGINIYDCRHWDYETNNWELIPEEKNNAINKEQ